MADVLPYSIPSLKIEKVFDSTAELGDLAVSPTGEVWVLERAGTLKVYRLGEVDATLAFSVSTSCDSGLLDVAFDPDHRQTGLALVSYVDTGGQLKVDQVYRTLSGLSNGGTIINVGTTSGGCRTGGGLAVGPDGKLYVGVGDLEQSADAQNDASLSGKVLRANLNGTVPADNVSGTLVWAKGFRNAKDVALNPDTTRPGGTLYLSDLGTDHGSGVFDELNAPGEGDNFGWDDHDGPGGSPSYVDPLVSYDPTVQPESVEVLSTSALGAQHEGSVTYACMLEDEIRQAVLTGGEMDTLDFTQPFYDPDGDHDGTPDIGCPHDMHAMAMGNEGWLYAANHGSNPGIWRIWRDDPGPREVSAAGSPFPLTVVNTGSNLKIGWEQLGAVDVGRPGRHGGQHSQNYQVWEGPLPIPPDYGLVSLATTDGTLEPGVEGYLTTTVNPSAGNRFFLVTAQNDNMEQLGAASDGTPRPSEDYCDGLYGIMTNDCATKWINPSDGTELYLTDYNPNSPTYMQQFTMSDFRGKVVRMDISSNNCGYCKIQAGALPAVDEMFRDRDYMAVTIFTRYHHWEDGNQDVWPTYAYTNMADCATDVAAWSPSEESPIFCDTDHNGDGIGDVSWQYWHSSSLPPPEDCGGTPHNFYIDQGGTIYEFVCGAEFSSSGIALKVMNEVNAETCE
jgi:hypothetical protein